jgi:hypothetical protein
MGVEDMIQELKLLCPAAKQAMEGGIDYVLLPSLSLPNGCNPSTVDCLLSLGARDGYENRLFFAQMIQSSQARNWNGQNVRILERNWFAYSWKVPGGLRPIEILAGHLQALR